MGQLSRWVALAVLFAAATFLGASPASAVVLTDGHVDYGARMIGETLQSQIKDTTQGPSALVWREPSEVLFGLGPQAKVTIPSGSKVGFLGPPGTTVWMIPQVQRAGVLWAGWNTEEVDSSQVSGGIAWTLAAVEGPGTVAIFQTGSFGDPDVIFNSADGLPDARTIPLGTHAHGNWSFTQPGEYRLTFTMSAQLSGGGTSADTEVLAVRVEDDATGPDSGGDGGGGGSRGDDGSNGAKRAKRSISSAAIRARVLTLAISPNWSGQARVAIRQAGRIVDGAGPNKVGPAQRRLRFRLAKPLEPGRYSVRLTVRMATGTLTRAVPLRVAGRR